MPERPVLAYYYGVHSHDVPQQIQQAQSAGIDGFIVWWDGVGIDRDREFQQVLQADRATGFHATIHFHAWTANLAQELRGFYEQRFADPGLVTYQGRPVLFFWATWLLITTRGVHFARRLTPTTAPCGSRMETSLTFWQATPGTGSARTRSPGLTTRVDSCRPGQPRGTAHWRHIDPGQ